MPSTPPAPISATWDEGSELIVVTFDLPLDPATIAPASFIARAEVVGPLTIDLDLPTDFEAAGSTLEGPGSPSGVAPGAIPRFIYDGSDPTLRGLSGIPVAAFSIEIETV